MKFLAQIAAEITHHSRYKVKPCYDRECENHDCHFWWGTPVYNLFRLYELIFWRRHGVRIEETYAGHGGTINGVTKLVVTHHKLYTWEARSLFIEKKVYEFFKKLASFRIHILAVAPIINDGVITIPSFPYALTVAFDSEKSGNSGASVISSKSDTITFVGSPTAVAIGGELVIKAGTTVGGAAVSSLIDDTTTPTSDSVTNFTFYDLSPANGNVVWAFSPPYHAMWNSAAMTGTKTSAAIGGQAYTHGTTSSNPSESITTQSASSLVVDNVVMNVNSSGARPSGTGQVFVSNTGAPGTNNFYSTGCSYTPGSGGSITMTWDTANNDWYYSASEFLPPGAGGTTTVTPRLLTMKVG